MSQHYDIPELPDKVVEELAVKLLPLLLEYAARKGLVGSSSQRKTEGGVNNSILAQTERNEVSLARQD